MRNYWYGIFQIFVLLAVCFCILICLTPVNARSVNLNYSIEMSNTSDTNIVWDVGYLTSNYRPVGATFDGVEIEGFNTRYNISYSANELSPDTYHSLCLYDNSTILCDIGNTTRSKEPVNQIADVIYLYLFAILAVFFIVVSIWFKVKESSMVAFVFCVIGIAYFNLEGAPLVIHGLIAIASIYSTFREE